MKNVLLGTIGISPAYLTVYIKESGGFAYFDL